MKELLKKTFNENRIANLAISLITAYVCGLIWITVYGAIKLFIMCYS